MGKLNEKIGNPDKGEGEMIWLSHSLTQSLFCPIFLELEFLNTNLMLP